jgi:hypothetical protein
MPLEPYQFASGRRVKPDDDADELLIVDRILAGQGGYLIVSDPDPAGHPGCFLVSEAIVRDTFVPVEEDADANEQTVVQAGTTSAPSNLDARLNTLERGIAALLEDRQAASIPAADTDQPGTGGTGETVPPEPTASTVPAAETAHPSPVVPAHQPSPATPAPGPASVSQ